MFRVNLKIDKKDFMSCNIYYLRKYFGVKEIVLISLLLIAGIVLNIYFGNSLMMIAAAVAFFLIGGSMVFYLVTSQQTFKFEFVRRGTTHQEIIFLDDKFEITTFEREKTYKDMFYYNKIDRIAIKNDVVYIYATTALNYYIKRDSFSEGKFDEFCIFIREKVNPMVFKMKQKKKKIKPDYLNINGGGDKNG